MFKISFLCLYVAISFTVTLLHLGSCLVAALFCFFIPFLWSFHADLKLCEEGRVQLCFLIPSRH